MTKKRFKLRLSKLGNGMITDTQKRDDLYFDKEFLDATLPKATEWLNKLAEENEELKQEVELLREGLDAYDNNLPLYLTCREVRDFNSDLFEFKIKQQKFYNKHPNRCKIIIDGVELK